MLGTMGALALADLLTLSRKKDLQVNSGTFEGMPLKRRNEVL